MRAARGGTGVLCRKVSARARAGGRGGAGRAAGAWSVRGRVCGVRAARGGTGVLGRRASLRVLGCGSGGVGRLGTGVGAGVGRGAGGAPAAFGGALAGVVLKVKRASSTPSPVSRMAVCPSGGRRNSQRTGPSSAKRRSRMEEPSRRSSVSRSTSPSMTAQLPKGCQLQGVSVGAGATAAGGLGSGACSRPQATRSSSGSAAARSLTASRRGGREPSSWPSPAPSPRWVAGPLPGGGGRRLPPAPRRWGSARPGPASR